MPRQRIDQMIASNAGEIECFQLPRAGFGKTAREEPGAMRRPEEGEDRVSARVHVVHRQQQLTEPGLPEILGQELDVFARQIEMVGRRKRRCPADQPPQFGGASVDQCDGRQRRAEQPRQRTHSRSTPVALSCQRRDRVHDENRDTDQQRKQDQPGDDRRQHRRVKQRVDPPRVRTGECRTGLLETKQCCDHPGKADNDGEPPGAQAAEGSRMAAAATANPARRSGRRQPYSLRAAGCFQIPDGSHKRAPPSIAAKSADAAPIPRPPTTSTLMPASCSARRTPA